jgi:hypothetical protein
MLEQNHEGEVLTTAEALAEALEASKNREAFLGAAVQKWADEWQKAKALLEASIEEDGVDTDNLGHSLGLLVELFEIDFYEEVDVKMTITYSGTISVKKGANLWDMTTPDRFPYAVSVAIDGVECEGTLSEDDIEFDY